MSEDILETLLYTFCNKLKYLPVKEFNSVVSQNSTLLLTVASTESYFG